MKTEIQKKGTGAPTSPGMGGLKLKSHSPEEIIQALREGLPVWALDTGTSGEDDTLIGEYEEVVADILAYYGLADLPAEWSLERAGWIDLEGVV